MFRVMYPWGWIDPSHPIISLDDCSFTTHPLSPLVGVADPDVAKVKKQNPYTIIAIAIIVLCNKEQNPVPQATSDPRVTRGRRVVGRPVSPIAKRRWTFPTGVRCAMSRATAFLMGMLQTHGPRVANAQSRRTNISAQGSLVWSGSNCPLSCAYSLY